MAIDFFAAGCSDSSKCSEFGLCDDPPSANNRAYIDEVDSSKWIGIVKNGATKNIDFIAIDACIDIRKADNNLESRCDGLLSYENKLIFVELKNRESGQWVKKGREQLTITINRFKNEYDLNKYDEVSGHICNSLRPISHVGHAANIQQFLDDTGLILRTDREIVIN